eukprot:TRINITY_DN8904_c0_g4_i1.p2 TRINITY_DN8904_c0_g4~~TRINITY_DN8904_c0_g4_i1.p2  ORF type:complete len:428 (-),score=0.97 TRINITY_DN8904_c0_g4_i1:1789-3036(-)
MTVFNGEEFTNFFHQICLSYQHSKECNNEPTAPCQKFKSSTFQQFFQKAQQKMTFQNENIENDPIQCFYVLLEFTKESELVANSGTVSDQLECLQRAGMCMSQLIADYQYEFLLQSSRICNMLLDSIEQCAISVAQPMTDAQSDLEMQLVIYTSLLLLLTDLFSIHNLLDESLMQRILVCMCNTITNPDVGIHVRGCSANVIQNILEDSKQNKQNQKGKLQNGAYTGNPISRDCRQKAEPFVDIQMLFDVVCVALKTNLTIAVHQEINVQIGSTEDAVYQCIIYIMTNYPAQVYSRVMDMYYNMPQDHELTLLLLPQVLEVLSVYGNYPIETKSLDWCFWMVYYNIIFSSHYDKGNKDSALSKKGSCGILWCRIVPIQMSKVYNIRQSDCILVQRQRLVQKRLSQNVYWIPQQQK